MPHTHTVAPGECWTSLADRYGFHSPEMIHQAPQNKTLAEKRNDIRFLVAGDQVFIPDVATKTFSFSTNEKHEIQIQGLTRKLSVKIHAPEGQSYAGCNYRLLYQAYGKDEVVDDVLGADGLVERELPAQVIHATLQLWLRPATSETEAETEAEPKPSHSYQVRLGYLDPQDTTTGAQSRLKALGYYFGAVDDDLGPKTAAGLKSFQRDHHFNPTGELDDALQQKLQEVHGC